MYSVSRRKLYLSTIFFLCQCRAHKCALKWLLFILFYLQILLTYEFGDQSQVIVSKLESPNVRWLATPFGLAFNANEFGKIWKHRCWPSRAVWSYINFQTSSQHRLVFQLFVSLYKNACHFIFRRYNWCHKGCVNSKLAVVFKRKTTSFWDKKHFSI